MSNGAEKAPPGNDLLETETKQAYTRYYLQTVKDLATKGGYSLANLNISERALASALAEASKDIRIMQSRRLPKDGLSPSKIAGIITFRLARWAPVQMLSPLCEDRVALKLNFLAAFAFSARYILKLNLRYFPSEVTGEFQYTLSRRHTNQETLGMAYEMMSYHMQQRTTPLPV